MSKKSANVIAILGKRIAKIGEILSEFPFFLRTLHLENKNVLIYK